ncbi:glycosyl/glycerophosphate transferase [Microbacterium mangrovi]|uniref:Glycosyl/glycerophosphate transferase n=1 Tax=Microbacterium mangrovi TaxID=1348253 RepID=A0A0B2A1P2_9MICO|nr:CDP-glycerol glycerophosphotransferase family protein [Microbacterium mangrovi]KHK97384.1 glycosyl/glycerophosphate transferase [Microbacterium mangrovi]
MTAAEFTIADGPALELSGDLPAPRIVRLVGRSATTEGSVSADGDRWHAVVPLRASHWGGPLLPLPVGEYELTIDGARPEETAVPLSMLGPLRAVLEHGIVRVGPPMDPAYDSGEGQAALERRYATRPGRLENAAFFESRLGHVADGDPYAIDRELAGRAPRVTRYWSVVDLSVDVPEGAIPVVEGSPQWWRARGAARLLVVDDWLRRRFVRSRGQVVLQTWHGSPPRRLGLRLPGWNFRRAVAVVRESLRWNVLLAQSPFAARSLRRGYAFNRTVWIEGGPRNDELVTGVGAEAARAALGIRADEKVLLYAVLDPDAAARVLPADIARRTGWVVVRIGATARGTAAEEGRVIDATGYPRLAHLLLCADALVTDRSPVMFDFSVTGKPMFFVAPSAGDRPDGRRPVVVDLESRAPGPVVRTADGLVAAMGADDQERYAGRYAQWRAVFNARDDGHAAARVVARILDQGFVRR